MRQAARVIHAVQRTQALSLAALRLAIEQRRPAPGLLHHSDQGSRYVGSIYQDQFAQQDFIASMSRKGNAYDNAVVESFFGNLKNEYVHHRSFDTREQARAEIFDYMELFYNRHHAHAALQYMSPVDYEDSHRVTKTNCPENSGYFTLSPITSEFCSWHTKRPLYLTASA